MISVPKVKFSSGNSIPKLGLGTWNIGGLGQKRDHNNNDELQKNSIRKAIDLGFTFIRTAHNYAEGHCEELVGEVIKSYDRRKLFLVSCANQGTAVDKRSLIEVAKGSLKNLKTDYFDLYLIGGINPDTSVKDLMDGLTHLQEHHLTKDIGVSNYRLPELRAAVEYTGTKIVYGEVHYNLVIREPEIDGTLDFCRKNNIILSAYRPLQLGQLSKPGIELLDQLVLKYNKTQSQIALRWLIQKDGVVTVTKAISQKHMEEDLDIFDWSLESDDVEKLDKDFPIQIRISDCSVPRKFKF